MYISGAECVSPAHSLYYERSSVIYYAEYLLIFNQRMVKNQSASRSHRLRALARSCARNDESDERERERGALMNDFSSAKRIPPPAPLPKACAVNIPFVAQRRSATMCAHGRQRHTSGADAPSDSKIYGVLIRCRSFVLRDEPGEQRLPQVCAARPLPC